MNYYDAYRLKLSSNSPAAQLNWTRVADKHPIELLLRQLPSLEVAPWFEANFVFQKPTFSKLGFPALAPHFQP
jgi:hypothetical protein